MAARGLLGADESGPDNFESFLDSEIAQERQGPEEILELPLLPARDTVVFPHMVAPLFVGRERSIRAVETAMARDQRVAVFAQRDEEVQDPGVDDLYGIGTEVAIGRLLRMPDGTSSVWIQGRRRIRLLSLVDDGHCIKARVETISEVEDHSLTTEALMRAVLALFEKVVRLSRNINDDAYVAAMNIEEPGWLADLIGSVLNLDVAQRQELLETDGVVARLQKVSVVLAKELDVLELENRIHSQVQQEVDKSQREFFLREQMRAIQNELGEGDPQMQDIAELREKIACAGMPDEVRERATRELDRLATMPAGAPEVGIIRTYVDWLVALPWCKATEDKLDIVHAARILEENHFGLPKAKERILEHIAVRKLAGDKMRSPILCFVGPPGTGKTSLGKSIAQALGRNFVRVSLGGIRDEAEIRGHRRTYVGALPGRILQTMRRAGSVNPLFMLDEIDKIGIDFRGDPSAALLEVLDPEQNNAFSDHYLEVPYDLSRVVFITTANILDPVPPALRDRLEVIEFLGYIEEEKLEIARRFLVPRQREQHGLERLSFSDDVLRQIIREYTCEAGVRNLERSIANICRRVARRVAEGKHAPVRVSAQSLLSYLGPPEFSFGLAEEKDEVGVATGLAWTESGGDTLSVEVSAMDGKGSLSLTGQLGEVMQESAQAALSYARAHAKELHINGIDFDKIDIHVHVPEGAIPKDGPSAGITIATALISTLTGRAVHREVALTGEITLRGRVLPIGGVREKLVAAYRAGIKTLVLPKKNEKDLVDVPKNVLKGLRLVTVERMDQVLEAALLPEQVRSPRLPTRRSRPAAPRSADQPVAPPSA
ncbi:MAG: endopeptidase La [Anaerolineae bacterium]